MNLVYLLILLALVQFIFFTFRTGLTRGKYNIQAPKTTGDDTWERIFRVQQNTMEQLVLFVPGMLAFAHFVSPTWALVPGVLYLVGRQVFSYLYITNPTKRAPGVFLSFFSNIALVVGSLIGLLLQGF